jgi:putative protease
MQNVDGGEIGVAPGNGHRVWIPLPAELPGAMLARFV